MRRAHKGSKWRKCPTDQDDLARAELASRSAESDTLMTGLAGELAELNQQLAVVQRMLGATPAEPALASQQARSLAGCAQLAPAGPGWQAAGKGRPLEQLPSSSANGDVSSAPELSTAKRPRLASSEVFFMMLLPSRRAAGHPTRRSVTGAGVLATLRKTARSQHQCPSQR